MKENYFVKVKLLNNKKYIYQLPNDLRKAMIDYEKEGNSLKDYFKDALINVPLTRYDTEQGVKLGVGKITSVFKDKRRQYWRTRGQFIVKDNYKNKSFKELKRNENFLKHDYSNINKARILRDFYKWIKIEQGF